MFSAPTGEDHHGGLAIAAAAWHGKIVRTMFEFFFFLKGAQAADTDVKSRGDDPELISVFTRAAHVRPGFRCSVSTRLISSWAAIYCVVTVLDIPATTNRGGAPMPSQISPAAWTVRR